MISPDLSGLTFTNNWSILYPHLDSNISFDCDIQRWSSCTHWSQEHHPELPIYHTNHGGLTLWNTLGWQLWSKFGAPPRRKLFSRNIWRREAINNCSAAPQAQDARPMDQELPGHICQDQVKCFQVCIKFQPPRWRNLNVLCYCKNGSTWYTCRMLRHQI